ncbi:MAG: PA3496 family putative envelope integrity protein [Cognaticolwellia sp.]
MNDDLTNSIVPIDADEESYDQDMPTGAKATHSSEVRKRIDDLLERKRLKALLDDADDWDI